ncbi:hypothetical protein D3C73_1425410 [compost metagenome]
MCVIADSNLIMPPSLRNARHLAGHNCTVDQLLGERVDKRYDGAAGNTVDELGCILVDVRLHDILHA